MDVVQIHPAHAVDSGPRLEPMLIRLPRPLAGRLRELARTTRIRQSDYLREAVADLLEKYANVDPALRAGAERP